MSLLAEIDVDGLVAARQCLARVTDWTDGQLEDIESADDDIRAAISYMEEEGTYETSLSNAIDFVDEAVEIVEWELKYVTDMHQAGRIRRSEETVEAVIAELKQTLRHMEEWAEGARSELRGLD